MHKSVIKNAYYVKMIFVRHVLLILKIQIHQGASLIVTKALIISMENAHIVVLKDIIKTKL